MGTWVRGYKAVETFPQGIILFSGGFVGTWVHGYVGQWVRWYDDLDDCTSELLPWQEEVDPLQELLDGLP